MKQFQTKFSPTRRALGMALALLAFGGATLAIPGPVARAQDAAPAADRPLATQRTMLAYYHYHYQGDPRKSVPLQGIRDENGMGLFTNHPWESIGPWMSYDRAQWHKNHFQMMAAAGVDVALAIFRGDAESRRAYAIKGLDVMVQGLKELRTEGLGPLMRAREYPQIGLALDLEGLSREYGGPVSLKDADVHRSLYGMIRDFYLHIPDEFRATVQLPAQRLRDVGPVSESSIPIGAAYVVTLINDAAVKDADGSFVQYADRRFADEFGARLVWVGTPKLKELVPTLDGVSPYPAAQQPAVLNQDGWLKIASAGPGYDNTGMGGERIRPRENGQQTVLDFRRIMNENPDWVILDSWNGYSEGTDIAPSLQYGLLYRDLIRAAVLQFKQSADYAVDFLKASVPRVMQPGALYQVDVVVQNSGAYDWDQFNSASLSYRWLKDGKYVGEDFPGALVPIPGLARGDKKTVTVGLLGPRSQQGPLPNGNYELEFNMMRRVGNEMVWFDQSETTPYRIPVTLGSASPARPHWINTTLTPLMKRGATYPVTVRLRNDGSDTWKKGELSIGYRWRRVQSYLKGGKEENTVVAEGKRIPLAADVEPGRLLSLDVPVTAADAGGEPLLTWSPKEEWVYVLEWDLYSGSDPLGAKGSATLREPVQVVDRDPGVSFVGCNLTAELVAGKTEKVTVALLNRGPETWKAGRDKVVVHWYYLDGTEASWNDEELPLTQDVAPFSMVETEVPDDLAEKYGADSADGKDKGKDRKKGGKGKKRPTRIERVPQPVVLRDVPVRVPYYFGPMYCVFDFQHDGLNAGTSPASRGNDILVIPVNVYSPTFTPVPLAAFYNLDGVSQDVDRTDGNIDGRGNSLPAEFLPPYVPRPSVGVNPSQNPLYPSGLWARPLNRLNSTRVCFMYPNKQNQTPNMIESRGQRVPTPPLQAASIHLLAACTEQDVVGEFTLYYTDGSSEQKEVSFTHWNQPPKHGEQIAFVAPHRHTATGDDPATRCYLNHYIIPVDRLKRVGAVEFPRNPAVKVLAMTVEAATVPIGTQ